MRRVAAFVLALGIAAAAARAPSLETALPSQPPGAAPVAQRVLGGHTDPALIHAQRADPRELPSWEVPGIPNAAEAYYAPDSYHLVAQTQDPDARHAEGRSSAALTWVFADDGSRYWRINDRGQDACSFFFPDGKQVIFTSLRDHPELPLGNWSDERDYPRGAELYVADLDGGHLRRITDNGYYEAEVAVSPDGRHIAFARQVDGAIDLYVADPDGSHERRITDTPDWQEGAPLFLPDSRTITTRAWLRADFGKVHPTPMTIFTIDTVSGERIQRTHDRAMNWSPFPAPDGHHYVFVRPLADEPSNLEIWLGDLEGSEPLRLTYHDGFDGFPTLSPDGAKLAFARSTPGNPGLRTWIMDVSSLRLGPRPVSK